MRIFILCMSFATSVFGGLSDAVNSLDTDEQNMLNGITKALPSNYIEDARTLEDVRTLIDDVAEALHLGSETRSELERQIASVLDSDKLDNSLSSGTCREICDDFAEICADETNDDSFTEWIDDECVDQCTDDGYEGICYCCLREDLRCENKDMSFILEHYCARSLFGHCGGHLTTSIGDCRLSPASHSESLKSNIIRQIGGNLDSSHARALSEVLDNLSQDYLGSSVDSISDLRTVLDDIRSALSLGTDTFEELESALAGVIDATGSLGTATCEEICFDFRALCDDNTDSDFDDWLQDECIDECLDEGREGSCFCCQRDFACIEDDLKELIDKRCKRSLVGVCRDGKVPIGECEIEQKLQKPFDIIVDMKTKKTYGPLGLETNVCIAIGGMFTLIITITLLCCLSMWNETEDDQKSIETSDDKIEMITTSSNSSVTCENQKL